VSAPVCGLLRIFFYTCRGAWSAVMSKKPMQLFTSIACSQCRPLPQALSKVLCVTRSDWRLLSAMLLACAMALSHWQAASHTLTAALHAAVSSSTLLQQAFCNALAASLQFCGARHAVTRRVSWRSFAESMLAVRAEVAHIHHTGV